MTWPLQLRFVPDLAALYRVLMRLEEGERASRDLDADVFEALGWRVLRDRWMALSPLSRTALPLPSASRRSDCAALVLPPRWDWSAGMRSGRAFAWCRSEHPEGHPDLLWFEAISPAVPALALLKAGLHARRALLLRESEAGCCLPADRWTCDCGWVGPRDAARADACPDCRRQIHEAAA
ncbi:hypothetical protein GXW74_15705 [Roseomonas eburnea]|uniref:Uncharacterized protein n=1 Tax=Neoroseomonas eburnea TaxID=1346889 RepID=A0A9X9XE04_9PROT|nr:hypothetical protein [Neoroseomonas eburnea]MBR0681940.1 hypothetical protein [Neoroseomonas eburnea]